MNTQKFLFTALISAMLTSCGSASYFQVYKAKPSEALVNENNRLIYEDDNCKVLYDLWDQGGDIGYQFYNKSNENIYLNLEESFFILNGISFNYYQNRVFTNSQNSGTSSTRQASASKSVLGLNYLGLLQANSLESTSNIGMVNSAGKSVSYTEEKIIIVPPHSSKIISEYSINESIFRDCDLLKYPSKKEIRSVSFSRENSPIVFSNRIAYSLGESNTLIKFENEFYVTEISNYPESEIVESSYDEYCDQKSAVKTPYIKDVSADKFYIKYTKGQDYWKH